MSANRPKQRRAAKRPELTLIRGDAEGPATAGEVSESDLPRLIFQQESTGGRRQVVPGRALEGYRTGWFKVLIPLLYPVPASIGDLLSASPFADDDNCTFWTSQLSNGEWVCKSEPDFRVTNFRFIDQYLAHGAIKRVGQSENAQRTSNEHHPDYIRGRLDVLGHVIANMIETQRELSELLGVRS